jgi:hypothetical protein
LEVAGPLKRGMLVSGWPWRNGLISKLHHDLVQGGP